MNAPAKFGSVTYHRDLIQGSDEWLQQRCGLLTASEMKLILGVSGGGTVAHYRASGARPEKLTAKREQALDLIGNRVGSISDLCFLADVSDGVLRGLLKDGAIERVAVEQPRRFFSPNDDRMRAHVFEIAAQRMLNHVEPHYVSDDMLRGHDDEIEARMLYDKHYAPVSEVGFVTNDRWGFTIGYSPDALVGDDGQIECKSRRQKYQVQTIARDEVPEEFVLQLQTGLLVTERAWIDFVSYSGGQPLFVKRVEPDPEIQEAIISASVDFEQRVADCMRDYDATLATMKKLIPTERRVEQEMYV